MARTRDAENDMDPATGKPLPPGVQYRGPLQYRVRKLVKGSRISKTFDSSRLAREWLQATDVAAAEGTFVDRRELDHWSIERLVQRFVAEEMQDGGERRGAAEDRGHIPSILNDAIARVRLSEVTRFDVQAFGKRQLKSFSKATVVKRLNILQQVFAAAINRWGLPMVDNPATAEAAPRPKGSDKKRARTLYVPGPGDMKRATELYAVTLRTEEEALYEAVAASKNPWDLPLTRFCLEQATRQGEALGLRWGNVDLERRILTLHGRHGLGTKNIDHREERGPEVRALMPRAIAVLVGMGPSRDRRALIFPVGSYMAFRVRWGRLVARAASRMEGAEKELGYLQDLTFHDLRHVATKRLSEYFPNSMELMDVTGHRDVRSTKRYYNTDPAELAAKAAAAEAAMRARDPK